LIFDTKTRMNNKFRLVINDHIVFYSGKGMKTSEHSNPAITIIISQSDHFEILSEKKKTTSNFSILPANYKHTFSSDKDTNIAMFFIEQVSNSSNNIKNSINLCNDILNLDKSKYQINEPLLFDKSFATTDIANFISIFTLKSSKDCFTNIDKRIIQTIKLIEDNATNNLTPNQLSKQVFISESRLRYLFKKEMGVSISKFIRWKKLRTAGINIRNGMNFIEACYSSGFYDPAHFNRVFKEMLGVNPSDVLK